MSALLGVLVAALLLAAPGAAKIPRPFDVETQTLLNMRVTGSVLQTYVEMDGELGLEKQRIVTVVSVAPALDPELARQLLPRDGWGRPLQLMPTDAGGFVLISFGADGKADAKYEEGRSWRKAPASSDRDILWTKGFFIQKPERTEDMAKRAATDLQSIAHAMHAFVRAHDTYPATNGLRPLAEIGIQLEQARGKVVPVEDPWGQPYFAWSDGLTYMLACGGSDGHLDRAYVDAKSPTSALGVAGLPAQEGEDLLFANGSLARWVGATP
jgi:hypothetical protein